MAKWDVKHKMMFHTLLGKSKAEKEGRERKWRERDRQTKAERGAERKRQVEQTERQINRQIVKEKGRWTEAANHFLKDDNKQDVLNRVSATGATGGVKKQIF